MRAKSLTSASRVGVRYIESFLLLGSSDLRGLPEFGKNCAVCSAFVLTGQVYLLSVIKPSVHEVREVIKQCLCHVAS